ncbi:MAG: tetratricopeptide repeat protein [Chlorobi bacterium]|nr:tetratricopeptide repeat protein [Chlorobiota bacterium]
MKADLFLKFIGSVASVLFIVGGTFPLHAQDKLNEARIAYSNKDYLQAAEFYKEVLRQKPKDEKILVEAGDVYMVLELYDTARDLYQRAYNQDSRDGEINRKLGTAHSFLGEHDQAIEKLRRAFKFDDESLESRLALADGFLRIGTDSLNKAQIVILQAKKEFPENPQVYVALGDLYFQQGIFQLSEDAYKEAINLNQGLIEPRIRLGISYREQGKRENKPEFYQKALEQFNYVTEAAPKEPVPWRQQGEILFLAGLYDQAIASLKQYQELRPDDSQGDYIIALTASRARYYSIAIEPAKRIIRRDDDRSKQFRSQAYRLVALGYYSKAQTAANNGDVDSARTFYSLSAETYAETPDSVLDPNDVIYHGTALMWNRDTVQGLQVWANMIELFPDSCGLAYTVARGMFGIQRYNEFLSTIDRIESICGKNFASSIPTLRGLAYFNLKQHEDAINAFNEAIANDSSNFDSYYWLLNTLITLKEYEDIPSIVDRMAQHINPDEVDSEKLAWCHYFKGIALFNADEFNDAIEDFLKAVELKSDHLQAYLYTAVSYHTLKNKQKACEFYQKVLQYDPENQYAAENAKKLGC